MKPCRWLSALPAVLPFLLLVAPPASAASADFPTKPIRLIVPFPPAAATTC